MLRRPCSGQIRYRLITHADAHPGAELDTSGPFCAFTAEIALPGFSQEPIFVFDKIYPRRSKCTGFCAESTTDAVLLIDIHHAILIDMHGFLLQGAGIVTGMIDAMLTGQYLVNHRL
jgi:hypothetical protein